MEPDYKRREPSEGMSDAAPEPASRLRTAAWATLAIGFVSLLLGFVGLVGFFMTAIVFMDNPDAATPIVFAIQALFLVGFGSLLLGCVLLLVSESVPH